MQSLVLKEMRKYIIIEKGANWNYAENSLENSEKWITSDGEDLMEEQVFWYLNQIFSDELHLINLLGGRDGGRGNA